MRSFTSKFLNMINATEIAFTIIPVSSIGKGRQFYEGVLGLKTTSVFEKGDMGFIEYDIGAGTLAIGVGLPCSSQQRKEARLRSR